MLLANEVVENMELAIRFLVETRLSDGQIIGQPYWDAQPIMTSKEIIEPPEQILPMQ